MPKARWDAMLAMPASQHLREAGAVPRDTKNSEGMGSSLWREARKGRESQNYKAESG